MARGVKIGLAPGFKGQGLSSENHPKKNKIQRLKRPFGPGLHILLSMKIYLEQSVQPHPVLTSTLRSLP